MANLRCGPLTAIDDLDETFFMQFLNVKINKIVSLAVPFLGSGSGLSHFQLSQSGGITSATIPSKGQYAKITKRIREKLKMGKQGKLSDDDRLQLNDDVEKIQKTLISGGLWQKHRISIGHSKWLVGYSYRQTWFRRDVGAGRLIASVPVGLYPGTKKIDLKIWSKTVEVSTDTATTESLYSTEISASDKWALATKKLFAIETSTDINPSATLNSIAVSVPSVINVQSSGSLGIAGKFTSNIKDQIDTTSDYISDQTFKAASSLKSSRTIQIQVTTEAGVERATSETLHNPGRGNTLNYLYWEILETYEIRTQFDRVAPFLSVPLPFNKNVTPEWLLLNECAIRPYLPCEKFATGFDAAKELLRLEAQLELLDAQFGDSKTTPAEQLAAMALKSKVDSLIDAYDKLLIASPANGQFGNWLYWSLVGIVAGNDLARGLKELKSSAAAASKPDDLARAVDGAFQIIGSIRDVFSRVKSAITSLTGFSALLGCSLIPPLGVGMVIGITALAVAAEAIGVDLVPDDEGLEDAVRKVKKALDDYRSAKATPTATNVNGFNPELRASLMREQLANQKTQAEIEFNRLADHVRDEIYYYHHAIWSKWSASRIAQVLLEAKVDPSLVEHRFYGFDMDSVIVRVVDLKRLESEGIEWLKFANDADNSQALPRTFTMQLPTPGVWAEAVHGSCDALDAFVTRHRDADIAIKEAELELKKELVAQQQVETDRLKARVAAGVLDDPTPYRDADRLEVKLKSVTSESQDEP